MEIPINTTLAKSSLRDQAEKIVHESESMSLYTATNKLDKYFERLYS
jgi:hypothetical protein